MFNSASRVLRVLRAVPLFVHVAAVGTLGVGTTGCGALSALTNPQAAWALDESTPVAVVVRRAELARATSEQVERLMGQTGVNDESEWIPETSLKKDDAEAILASTGSNDTYASAKGVKLRVTVAEAYVSRFSTICSEEDEHPSLLASTSPKLQSSYEEIARQQDDIGRLEAKIGDIDKELGKDGTSDARKAELEKQKEDLEGQIEKIEDAYDPKVEAFVALVREEAAKLSPEKKKSIGIALVNLRRAVEEAKNNNSVALLRYPMALPNLHNELEGSAKRVVADVIEEKTGKRPDMSGLKPEVKMENGDVKVSLNGLSPSDLLSLSPDEVIEETSLRLVGYVGRVTLLIAYADETQRALDFQASVLDAWMEGMKVDASSFPGTGDNLAELKVESAPGGKAKNAKETKIDVSKLGRFMPGGVRTSGCSRKVKSKEPEEETEVAEVVEEPKEKDAKGGKPAKTAQKDKPKEKQKDKPKEKDKPKATAAASSGQKPPASSSKPSGEQPAPISSPDPARCDIVVTTAEGSKCM
jgi:hypothetical protein